MPLASILYVYCLTSIVIVMIRNLLCGLISDEQRRSVCNEFFCTLLWCTWCLELRIMRDYYLVQSLIMYLFLCFKQFVCRGAFTNPCGVLADQMKRGKPFTQSILLLTMEILGLLCAILYSFGLCTVLSTYDLSQDHATFHHQTQHVTPLQVEPAWGFTLELGFTLVLCAMDTVFDPPIDTFFSSTIYMILYFIMGHHTGAYVNPLTSLGSTVGREGENLMILFFVYALGPLTGTAMAMTLLPDKNNEQ